jgi:DNA/RNA-binding domain of Phe-tRNA-synthetase-like protein
VDRFRYDGPITARFPAIVGGAVHARGLANGPSPPELLAACEAEQQAVRERIGATSLSELPSLAAWRKAFREFGVDPTAYRSAAEALLRRLVKQRRIPSINTLVDIGNLVSIRYALPVAVMDQRATSGGTTVRFASGDEAFTDLGSGERETPDEGEVIFTDEARLTLARRWCWRQSAESASGPGTTEVLITVEGHHHAAAHDVDVARMDLVTLLGAYAGAAVTASGVVTASAPAFGGLPSASGQLAAS